MADPSRGQGWGGGGGGGGGGSNRCMPPLNFFWSTTSPPPLFLSECFKIRLRSQITACERAYKTGELPGPVSEPWIPAVTDFALARDVRWVHKIFCAPSILKILDSPPGEDISKGTFTQFTYYTLYTMYTCFIHVCTSCTNVNIQQ